MTALGVAPLTARGEVAADFSIRQSPFAGSTDLTLHQAILAATQPVVQPPSPAAKQGPPAKRPRSAEASPDDTAPPPRPHHQQQHGAGKHRPPRPPALADSGSLVLDVVPQTLEGGSHAAIRSPCGGAASPSGSRRPARQLSKTAGRICLECGTTATTQWRSQGLLCNSCGVKLIKGRLPMDADAMHRRWLRLPPALRDHPMWQAAEVVAQAQAAAAAAAAAGQPWSCPGCGCADGERVAGPCGLQHCPRCAQRYQVLAPSGGAAAVAITMAAPAPCSSPPAPSPAGGGQKRRKQATPRSAATDSLSPLSLSSSGSSSIQAYSWQSTREEGQDDASSKEPTPRSRPASRRLQLRNRQQQGQQQGRQHPTSHTAAAAAAAPPPATPAAAKTPPAVGALGSPQQLGAVAETPTAAEAAAALLVLTESDEVRVAAAARLDAAQPVAAANRQPAPAEQPAATTASGPDKASGALRNAVHVLSNATPGAAAPPTVDSMQLYMQLIGAAATPEAAAAGLTHELVGKYLAAHTAPMQALAAASSAASPEVAAAVRAQQEQQARLVAAMAAERQLAAAVALMKSVVQLAGLAD